MSDLRCEPYFKQRDLDFTWSKPLIVFKCHNRIPLFMVRKIFSLWTRNTKITAVHCDEYQGISDNKYGQDVDIEISWENESNHKLCVGSKTRCIPFPKSSDNVLAHTISLPWYMKRCKRVIHINGDQEWDFNMKYTPGRANLYLVLIREIGKALSMPARESPTSIMNNAYLTYTNSVSLPENLEDYQLPLEDVEAIQKLYGIA